MLRSGISWKLNETVIELWHSSYDVKTSTTHSYCEDDTQNEDDMLNIDASKNESYLIEGDSHCRKRIPQVVDNEDDGCSLSDNEEASDDDKQIGEGINEDDSFLTTYNAKTISAVWQ